MAPPRPSLQEDMTFVCPFNEGWLTSVWPQDRLLGGPLGLIMRESVLRMLYLFLT